MRAAGKTLETSKRLGISLWEAAQWNIQFRHDAHVIYHTPRPSLVPESVRKLAFRMIEQAQDDLRDRPRNGYHYRPGGDYWADPEGAKAWIEAEHDRPLGFRWCCQVLGADDEASRKALLGRR